ncbi:DUF4826 family protein [Aliidiomarina halalkaliphila]|uniref:DUF4826 family protein n=1 Tax=Aliidiomarina halalkaliphila TaxID=2593535 RepID=A0A552X407_9GAMM|nr:DUF4826 family protein [Aliidiomarina halalkaliphila]TRW49770.1 DUF4826 family protein [Aliidiomarina halalkaliphila]
MNNQPVMTEEEQNAWVREQFQKANGYLVEKGMITDQVLTKESLYLVPQIAVWKFTLKGVTDKVWAITGVVPTDHVDAKVAENPRDALRHFSLRWQLRAEEILQNERSDATERKFAEMLVVHAEACYGLVQNEELWQGLAR